MRLSPLILIIPVISFASDTDQTQQKPFSFRFEGSYVQTSGNTNTETFSEKIEAKYNGEVYRALIKNSALLTRQDRRETANRFDVSSRVERLFTERFFGFGSVSYERDRFSGYDYKLSGGPGIGYDLIRTDHHELKTLLSYIYYYNRTAEGVLQQYPTLKAEANYLAHLRDNLRLKEYLSYIVNLSDRETYFINSETSLEVKINRYLSLGVGYKLAYQNKPPEPGIKRTDTTFSTSLIVDF